MGDKQPIDLLKVRSDSGVKFISFFLWTVLEG